MWKKKKKEKKKPPGLRSNISNDYEVFIGLRPGVCLSKVPIAFRAQKPGVIGSCRNLFRVRCIYIQDKRFQ